MNNIEKVTSFVEESFLSPLLKRPGLTDVSFNGECLFYEDCKQGRRRSGIAISNDDVGAFLRQIANMCERQFSYMSPILDVSFSRYRLNATFQSITRVFERKTFSFSLRIGHDGSAVSDDDSFFPGESKKMLLQAISRGESVVIAGETGAGKTELQKFLLMNLPMSTRVIVIDNVGELERCRGDGLLDLTSWMVDERFPDATFPALIRNALRNNPDYLVVAEARGGEMLSTLNAVMSGHPIITTLHARDIQAIPYRMARMAQSGDRNLVYDDLLGDIYHHFGLLAYVKKSFQNNRVYRRISALGRVNEEKKCVDILYDEAKTEKP